MRESCLERGDPWFTHCSTFLKQPPPRAGGTETGSRVPFLLLSSLSQESHLLFGLGMNLPGPPAFDLWQDGGRYRSWAADKAHAPRQSLLHAVSTLFPAQGWDTWRLWGGRDRSPLSHLGVK